MGPIVTPEDHDAGFKEVPLDYRRSPAPEGSPDKVRVQALTYVQAFEVNKQFAQKEDSNENFWRLSVLLTALPEPHNNVEFLNRLKPTCVNQLVLVALHLAYGAPEAPCEPVEFVSKKKRAASPSTVPA
jgi:hypothetical protein